MSGVRTALSASDTREISQLKRSSSSAAVKEFQPQCRGVEVLERRSVDKNQSWWQLCPDCKYQHSLSVWFQGGFYPINPLKLERSVSVCLSVCHLDRSITQMSVGQLCPLRAIASLAELSVSEAEQALQLVVPILFCIAGCICSYNSLVWMIEEWASRWCTTVREQGRGEYTFRQPRIYMPEILNGAAIVVTERCPFKDRFSA